MKFPESHSALLVKSSSFLIIPAVLAVTIFTQRVLTYEFINLLITQNGKIAKQLYKKS
jgi:hypothetical protein